MELVNQKKIFRKLISKTTLLDRINVLSNARIEMSSLMRRVEPILVITPYI